MKDFLKKAFPYLTIAASAVPGGDLAMSTLGQILKVQPAPGAKDVTWEDMGNALINATPEQRLALQQEENRHTEVMQQMGINSAEEFERVSAGDRDSARKREMSVKDKVPAILAIVVTVGFFASLWWVFIHGVKPESHDLAILELQTLATAWVGIIAYYFGSSAGSARKTELLAAAPPVTK